MYIKKVIFSGSATIDQVTYSSSQEVELTPDIFTAEFAGDLKSNFVDGATPYSFEMDDTSTLTNASSFIQYVQAVNDSWDFYRSQHVSINTVQTIFKEKTFKQDIHVDADIYEGGTRLVDKYADINHTHPEYMTEGDVFAEFSFPASTQWVVNHSLAMKRPNVTITDSSDNVFDGQITYVSDTEIHINFNQTMSGKVYLS